MNFGFPFFRFNNYPFRKYKVNQNKMSNTHNDKVEKDTSIKEDFVHSDNCKHNVSDNDIFFDVFGVKLYYDDILLISLIFFLYSEGVEDNSLFIALILLLLS